MEPMESRGVFVKVDASIDEQGGRREGRGSSRIGVVSSFYANAKGLLDRVLRGSRRCVSSYDTSRVASG